jgi:hypothetical protein
MVRANAPTLFLTASCRHRHNTQFNASSSVGTLNSLPSKYAVPRTPSLTAGSADSVTATDKCILNLTLVNEAARLTIFCTRLLKLPIPEGNTKVISSDWVYAKVAEGKCDRRSEQVTTIASCIR